MILVAWGLASWAFQRQLTREREDGGLQFGWRFVDVVALSLIIQLDDALMSPLTVAFAVLIVASAFWARAVQILKTTLLSMSAVTFLLVLIYRLNHGDLDHPYRHFHYLVGLALLGLMLIHQANRTRALVPSAVQRAADEGQFARGDSQGDEPTRRCALTRGNLSFRATHFLAGSCPSALHQSITAPSSASYASGFFQSWPILPARAFSSSSMPRPGPVGRSR